MHKLKPTKISAQPHHIRKTKNRAQKCVFLYVYFVCSWHLIRKNNLAPFFLSFVINHLKIYILKNNSSSLLSQSSLFFSNHNLYLLLKCSKKKFFFVPIRAFLFSEKEEESSPLEKLVKNYNF